ncbi:N-formylglutamate amidohydrolase [Sphingomonas canadensis]|uniref:N-formylglutamate amidohydrolase n=1 Tax=Sphingomonas canadensis TaxID=1219257 RepID=A0ABW3HCT2_9SPHN|nr:N-formylglutamate amidohydrolase [Sphingomonas canadensis]MCW3836712.1 N-formylglutamate amidohydrolase [Sphingomonas canadensis]
MSAPEPPAEWIDGPADDLLLLCDHASSHVPADIDLGIDPRLLDLHIAIDIGAADVTRGLAARLGAPAILGTVSRLVLDLHREPDHPNLVPKSSDGHVIPGNLPIGTEDRLLRFHLPYHDFIAARIAAVRPALILSIHSFTPRLEQGGGDRPWEVGVLYNQDERAARIAVPWLAARGLVTGDNEPYSGKLLNATLNRHAEANGIPSIAIEIRNDLIRDPAGVARWTGVLADLAGVLRGAL